MCSWLPPCARRVWMRSISAAPATSPGQHPTRVTRAAVILQYRHWCASALPINYPPKICVFRSMSENTHYPSQNEIKQLLLLTLVWSIIPQFKIENLEFFSNHVNKTKLHQLFVVLPGGREQVAHTSYSGDLVSCS